MKSRIAEIRRLLDDETLVIPDRLGNNRVDTIGNLLERPGVGLIFFVPGLSETLRVNGRARVTTDPALLEPLAVNGKMPRSGILIVAEEIYFHCGKALRRSSLWNPDARVERSVLPSMGEMIHDQSHGDRLGISRKELHEIAKKNYENNLY